MRHTLALEDQPEKVLEEIEKVPVEKVAGI